MQVVIPLSLEDLGLQHSFRSPNVSVTGGMIHYTEGTIVVANNLVRLWCEEGKASPHTERAMVGLISPTRQPYRYVNGRTVASQLPANPPAFTVLAAVNQPPTSYPRTVSLPSLSEEKYLYPYWNHKRTHMSWWRMK